MAAGSLGLSVAAGALTTLSPCVFPLLPLVVGGGLQKSRAAPLAMGLGMALSFAAAGMLVGAAGDTLGIDGDSLRTAGALLMIAFALVMAVPALDARFAAWISPLADRANRAADGLERGRLGGVLATGALLGLVWSPCSGPLLGSTLALAAGGGALRAGLTLGLFGVGAALPLVTVAYASRAGFTRLRDRVLRHAAPVKRVFAAVLALVGIGVLTGADRTLEAAVNGWLPDAWLALATRF